MFTGIVEELGRVESVVDLGSAARLTVFGPTVAEGSRPGDSIAVNGVCLTVVDSDGGRFTADVMQETLDRSSLVAVHPGDPVNLERPLRLVDRLGGHLVQGHVDGVGILTERRQDPHWTVVRISLPADLRRYVVTKGSISVDGISLTVSALAAEWFEVSLIPTTLALTTLGLKVIEDPVNLEVDVIAKYVERLTLAGPPAPGGGHRTIHDSPSGRPS